MKKTENGFKNMSEQDILAQVKEQKNAITKMRFAHAVNQLDRPSMMKNTRKEIARMLTELNSRNKA
ncbi:MAG: Ribosomal protein [Bacteroidota bacterium]